MKPGRYDLDLYRGDSYARKFRLWADDLKTVPLNLTGAVVEAEFRDVPGGPTTMSMVVNVLLPNIVEIQILPVMWPTAPPGDGVWDLEITFPDESVYTPIFGDVIVTADVTNSVPTTFVSFRHAVPLGRSA